MKILGIGVDVINNQRIKSLIKNKSFIISSDKNSIPKNAGIAKKIPNFIAFEIL